MVFFLSITSFIISLHKIVLAADRRLMGVCVLKSLSPFGIMIFIWDVFLDSGFRLVSFIVIPLFARFQSFEFLLSFKPCSKKCP